MISRSRMFLYYAITAVLVAGGAGLIISCLFLITPAFAQEATRTIKVGVYENRPKVFTNENGRPSGFWPEIIEYIASKEGWKVEYVHGNWTECLTRLEKNEIDIMPDVAFSEERAQLFDFSTEVVYVSWSGVYTRKGYEIKSILDLEGKNIAVLKGSINVEGPEGIKNLLDKFGVKCVFSEVDDYKQVFELVQNGGADAGVVSKDFAHANVESFNLAPTPIIFQPVRLYFAFSKSNAKAPSLLGAVDRDIKQLKDDRRSLYYSSLENWFGAKISEKSFVPLWLVLLLLGVGALAAFILGANVILNAKVKSRTAELRIARDRLIESQTLAHLGNWEWDIKADIIQGSDEFYRIFDVVPHGIARFSQFIERLHPDDRKRVENEVSESTEKNKPYDTDYRVKLQDGAWRDINAKGHVIKDGRGMPVRMIGTCQDITGRKRMEKELEQYREHLEEMIQLKTGELQTILDSVPAWIFYKDRENRFIRVNRVLAAVMGVDKRQLEGKSLLDIYPREQAESYWKDDMAVIESGRAKMGIIESMDSPEGTIWVRTDKIPYRDSKGDIIGIIGFSIDITETRKAEKELLKHRDHLEDIVAQRTKDLDNSLKQLSASEQRLRRIYDSGMLGVFYWNMNGQIVDANNKFLDMIGYTREEMHGGRIDWVNMTPKEYQHLDALSVEELQSTGVNKTPFEKVYIRKDGTRMPIIIAGAMLDEERFNGVALALDITDRKRAEEELQRTLVNLARSNRELEEFAYVASHDLQEPLRMVSSYTQLLERRYKDKLDDDARDFIKYAVDGANRMQRLINDLLDYSRVSTRGKPKERTDSYSALGEAIVNLQTAIEESRAVITNDDLPSVPADSSQLSRVFQNLIGNAVKFRGEEAPRIHVSARELGSEWVFEIKDNGIGIEKEYFDRIFVIFQRLHGKDEYPGTGIGLALCKRIVERHGGRIWLESELGIGSTFYFTIPR